MSRFICRTCSYGKVSSRKATFQFKRTQCPVNRTIVFGLSIHQTIHILNLFLTNSCGFQIKQIKTCDCSEPPRQRGTLHRSHGPSNELEHLDCGCGQRQQIVQSVAYSLGEIFVKALLVLILFFLANETYI